MATRRNLRISTEGSGVSLEELLQDPDNPFLQRDTPWTWYEGLKAAVNAPILLYRIVLVILILPFVWGWLALLTRRLPLNQPLPKWRAKLLIPVLCFWGQILLLLGFHLQPQLKGRENLVKAEELRSVLVYNHVSYLDALLIASLLAPSGLAKTGVADLPLFGSAAKAFQFLFVQRAGTTDPPAEGIQARTGNTMLIQQRSADRRYPLFAVSPEGTTKHSAYLLQFSTGAFVGGRPVTPVLIRYDCKYFDVGWGIIENVFWHFYRMQAQFCNKCTIEILPPYVPSTAEREDPRLYADNVRKLMGRSLGVKLSPYGIPEQQMLKRAKYCIDNSGRRLIQKQKDGTFREVDSTSLKRS